MKHKVDILNLEWETGSRDENIIEPVLVSLEERFGYTIIRDSIWYAFFKLLKYRPRILVMSNEIGAIENVCICRFAYAIGLKTIVLRSEGLNFECIDEKEQKRIERVFFWGNNKEQRRIWDMKLLWSEQARSAIYRYIEGSEEFNLKVSGATGFDSYRLLEFSGDGILNVYGKEKYKKVVLLIGYAFDLYHLFDSDVIPMSEETLKWLYRQRIPVQEIYKELIECNPDILFILKHHPGSINLEDTEFSDIMGKYDNTMVIHKEESIRNLLAVSDIVVAFDSTVCLEAWMLDKPTVLVCPEKGEFSRSWSYYGSPVVNDATKLHNMIKEYYTNGKISEFDSLSVKRKEMIEMQIQYDDGFNYLRAAKLIDEEIKKKRNHPKDRGIVKIAARRFIREACEYIIEKQPWGLIKKKSRKAYIERGRQYNKKDRELNVNKYKKGIEKWEAAHIQQVYDILDNFTGE